MQSPREAILSIVTTRKEQGNEGVTDKERIFVDGPGQQGRKKVVAIDGGARFELLLPLLDESGYSVEKRFLRGVKSMLCAIQL
jgi:hypothetical protein